MLSLHTVAWRVGGRHTCHCEGRTLHHLACSPDAHVGCGALLAGSRPELEVKTTRRRPCYGVTAWVDTAGVRNGGDCAVYVVPVSLYPTCPLVLFMLTVGAIFILSIRLLPDGLSRKQLLVDDVGGAAILAVQKREKYWHSSLISAVGRHGI